MDYAQHPGTEPMVKRRGCARRGTGWWCWLLSLLLASCSDSRSCVHTASCPVVEDDAGPPPGSAPGADPEASPDDGSTQEANDVGSSLGPVEIPTLSAGPAPAPSDGQPESADPRTDAAGSPTDAAGDGGSSDGDSTRVDDSSGEDAGGVDNDAGMDAGEPELEIPEGACTESPEDPENGAYVACDVTLDGETCELICDANYVENGNATCTEGEWSTQTCARLGSLTATIGDAQNGDYLTNATVYVEGLYHPGTEDCAGSAFCQTTDANGEVRFDDFPSGEQQVVIVKEGYDEIAWPIAVEPGADETVRLDALPDGFLSSDIVVILSWGVAGDLDLVLSVPTTAGQCVYFGERGGLDAEPFAHLEADAKGGSPPSLETIRIALNDGHSGPYYYGTYSTLVSASSDNVTLQVAAPTVRVIREGKGGAAEVQLFRLPETAVEDATDWHVFDMNGDGAITEAGVTESIGDNKTDSELICITEL